MIDQVEEFINERPREIKETLETMDGKDCNDKLVNHINQLIQQFNSFLIQGSN